MPWFPNNKTFRLPNRAFSINKYVGSVSGRSTGSTREQAVSTNMLCFFVGTVGSILFPSCGLKALQVAKLSLMWAKVKSSDWLTHRTMCFVLKMCVCVWWANENADSPGPTVFVIPRFTSVFTILKTVYLWYVQSTSFLQGRILLSSKSTKNKLICIFTPPKKATVTFDLHVNL